MTADDTVNLHRAILARLEAIEAALLPPVDWQNAAGEQPQTVTMAHDPVVDHAAEAAARLDELKAAKQERVDAMLKRRQEAEQTYAAENPGFAEHIKGATSTNQDAPPPVDPIKIGPG